uniref:L1 transposable element RRM domain-containing protein n=1 Tax=Poecilia formosa TaxID=48698 RepID=A0A087YSK6_POEFO
NKDRKKDKKDEKSVASKEVVAKANSSRSETDMAARDMGSTPDEEKIDLSSAQLQTSINGVKATLDKVLTRVAEAENRISQTEDAISELKQLTKQLKGDNEFLKKKIDQLENYSSRNNIRVLGLKEGSEVMDPVKFFTTWIPELLGAGGPAAQRLEVKIERAHRTGTMEPRPGEPPRTTPKPVLVRLLRFQDCEKILALAKKRGNVSFDNRKMSFFPDMSPELARRRKQLVPALQAISKK